MVQATCTSCRQFLCALLGHHLNHNLVTWTNQAKTRKQAGFSPQFKSLDLEPYAYAQLSPDDPNESECGRYLRSLDWKAMSSCDACAFANRRHLRAWDICQCRSRFACCDPLDSDVQLCPKYCQELFGQRESDSQIGSEKWRKELTLIARKFPSIIISFWRGPIMSAVWSGGEVFKWDPYPLCQGLSFFQFSFSSYLTSPPN